MEYKSSVFDRDIYAFISLIIAICKEMVVSQKRSFLVTKYMIYTIELAFSFFLITYLSLTILYYFKKKKRVFQYAIILLIAFAWMVLCYLLKTTTILVGTYSFYSILVACVYSIILDFRRKSKHKDW